MTDINDYLESLKTKLEEVIVEFQTKYNSLPQLEIDLLANINAVLGASSSGGLTPAEAKTATKEAIQEASNLDQIETKLDAIASQTTLSSILTQLQTDLGVLKTNTGKISQYQIQLAEDATNTVFIVRFDSISGSTANFTLSGASYTPVAPIQIVPDSSNLEIQANEFEAITTNTGNWAIGDILTRISIINTSTSAVTNIWQSASGTTLSTIPTIGIDVVDSDRKILELLRSLTTVIGTTEDIRIEDVDDTATLVSIIRTIAGFVDATRVELLDNTTYTENLLAVIGTISDPVATSDGGAATIAGLLKRLLTNKLPNVISGEIPTRDANARSILAALSVGIGTTNELPSIQDTNIEANSRLGSLTEAAPTTDTGSSGINGRLQRIVQRITSLIALLPTSLGLKTSAESFPVVVASDSSLSVRSFGGGLVGATSGSVTVPTAFMNVNSINQYENVVVKTTTITNGVLKFQASNDIADTNSWVDIEGIDSTTGSFTNVLSANSQYLVPVRFAAFRLFFTPTGSGSVGTTRYHYQGGNIENVAEAKSRVSLEQINQKLPSTLGQQTSANSFPVVLSRDLKVSTSGVVTVGTSVSTILASDPARKKLIITNPVNNAGTIYLATSSNFSLSATNYMIALSPGDSFLDNENVMTDQLIGISTVAATVISITTWV